MMVHPMHQAVVDKVEKAMMFMDDFLRDRIDQAEYARRLGELDPDSLLEAYGEDFKKNPLLVYYLDALMILSSLRYQLEFQVAEYGANVALEDMRNLEELLKKFPGSPIGLDRM